MGLFARQSNLVPDPPYPHACPFSKHPLGPFGPHTGHVGPNPTKPEAGHSIPPTNSVSGLGNTPVKLPLQDLALSAAQFVRVLIHDSLDPREGPCRVTRRPRTIKYLNSYGQTVDSTSDVLEWRSQGIPKRNAFL